ncbi:hypothetical protein [Ruminococcus sp.]|uniref:hypothetical protein n=1 Tax=Ruminococcus sp. TaxID=41978 RepID=UPI0025DEC099|nr:hypothetical protein [Ruminococcus sp.]MCR4638687.1 hypothetical protein [Ruminococcus sp.]
MKRAVKAFIAVYFAFFMCVFGGINAFAWNVDQSRLGISLGEVPDGTVFADILLKGSWNKAETDFNENNGQLLEAGRDSEIAKYSKDGYTSMLFRHNFAQLQECDITPEFDQKRMLLKLSIPSDEIFSHFRHIKLAYCDKDGNVIGITNEVKVKKSFWGMPAYTIAANGSSLTCNVNNGPPYFMIVLVPLTAAVLLFIITAAIIIVKVRKRRRQQK